MDILAEVESWAEMNKVKRLHKNIRLPVQKWAGLFAAEEDTPTVKEIPVSTVENKGSMQWSIAATNYWKNAEASVLSDTEDETSKDGRGKRKPTSRAKLPAKRPSK